MNVNNGLPCFLLKDCQTQYFIRVHDINQMMWNPRLFLTRGFGCADVHAPIKETRISRNNFAIEFFRELYRDFSFADGGGSDDEDEIRPDRSLKTCQVLLIK